MEYFEKNPPNWSNDEIIKEILEFKDRLNLKVEQIKLSKIKMMRDFEDHMSKIEKASKTIPILIGSNMSKGVIDLKEALKNYLNNNNSELIECVIEETHHTEKIDSPSGTALELKDYIISLNNKNIKLNITAVYTAKQTAKILKVINKKTKVIISIFAGRMGDVGKDPVLEFKKSIKF